MFAQITQIVVELLDFLLVRLGAFAFETVFELEHSDDDISTLVSD